MKLRPVRQTCLILLFAFAVFQLTMCSTTSADTFLSGFEGDFSSSLGVDWEAVTGVTPMIDPTTDLNFVTDGATEGSQGLAITHAENYNLTIQLSTFLLINEVLANDNLELDISVDGLNTNWRQAFVVMQGITQPYSQVEVPLVGSTGDPIATTNVSIDLSDPTGDGSLNWKQAAQNALADPDNQWWQLVLVFQGEDLDLDPQITTIIDNVRFTGGNSNITCDFDGDGFCDGIDVDRLTAAIVAVKNGGAPDTGFDLTSDGNVDNADLDQWLVDAGAENVVVTSGNPYLPADANLDGSVNGQDFVAWNNSKFTNSDAFTMGDFNADGSVNGQDFVVWNNVKFMNSDTVPAVPEPGTCWLFLLFATVAVLRRK